MDLVLQSQGGICSAAPRTCLDFAVSLLQMSVVGLPLLLALFQFVNDHEYPEPEDEIRIRTILYGFVMVASAFTLWLLYYSAFQVIRSELGAMPMTEWLSLFNWVLAAIIFVILLIQLEQMVGEGRRFFLAGYLLSISFGAVAFLEESVTRTAFYLVCGAFTLLSVWNYYGKVDTTDE